MYNSNESPPYSTDISSIRMRFVKQIKSRFIQSRKPKLTKYILYTPCIIVSDIGKEEHFFKKFNVITRGYNSAWNKAVIYLSIQKNIEKYNHLLKSKPPIARWLEIRNWQNNQGDQIPVSRLPNELKPKLDKIV